MDKEKNQFTKEERIIYRILIWLFCILCLFFGYAGYKAADSNLNNIVDYVITSII